MNEAETRAEHIDPALKAAGWGVVEGSRIRREYPIAPSRIERHGKRGNRNVTVKKPENPMYIWVVTVVTVKMRF
jgi:type I site-specific restriction endonuclease